MAFLKFIATFFTDNKRFWVCVSFYPSYWLMSFLVNTKLGRFLMSKMSQRLMLRIALHGTKVLDKTIRFKLEAGDRG